jgi:hypothetical protein
LTSSWQPWGATRSGRVDGAGAQARRNGKLCDETISSNNHCAEYVLDRISASTYPRDKHACRPALGLEVIEAAYDDRGAVAPDKLSLFRITRRGGAAELGEQIGNPPGPSLRLRTR